MENPYAQSAAPVAATPEQQKLTDYELVVGPNTDYYLPKFERYDRGESTVGWNWPAFFVTSGWYLYRKMWLWGLLNLFFPFIVSFVTGLLSALLKLAPATTSFLLLGLWFAEQMLLTLFANALYWRHVNNVVRNVPRSLADKPDKRTRRLERDGGTSIGAALGILIGVGVFGTGILAAIAIPAYQDYTIRAQVMDGMQRAESAKAVVAEYYAQKNEWPADADTAGLPPMSSKYVASITVANGSVVITFGGAANRNIADQRLILSPGLTASGEVVWACGEQPPRADVVSPGPGPRGADVKPKYLPSKCRPSPGT